MLRFSLENLNRGEPSPRLQQSTVNPAPLRYVWTIIFITMIHHYIMIISTVLIITLHNAISTS